MRYQPTRREIRAACEAIQDGWDEAERFRRLVSQPAPVYVREEPYRGRRLLRKEDERYDP